MTSEPRPAAGDRDENDGPFSHRKAIAVLAIVHLASFLIVAGGAILGVIGGADQSSKASLALGVLLTFLYGAFSFVVWIFLWHYNLRHVWAGLRLSKYLASPYTVDRVDGAKWIRARHSFAINRAEPGDEVFRSQGPTARLFFVHLASTPDGLAVKWFPRQRRLIPWTELTPLHLLDASDIVQPDSPFSRMISAGLKASNNVRPMTLFSYTQAPGERFLIKLNIAQKIQQASGGRWPTSPTHQPPPPPPTAPPPPHFGSGPR